MSARLFFLGCVPGAEAGLAMPCFVGLLDLGLNLAGGSVGVSRWRFLIDVSSISNTRHFCLRRVCRIRPEHSVAAGHRTDGHHLGVCVAMFDCRTFAEASIHSGVVAWVFISRIRIAGWPSAAA